MALKKFTFNLKKPTVYEIIQEGSCLGRGNSIGKYYIEILKERMRKFRSASIEMLTTTDYNTFLICKFKDNADEAAFLLEFSTEGMLIEEEDWEGKREASLMKALEKF